MIEVIEAANAFAVAVVSVRLEISLIGIIFIGLFITSMLVAISALWSSNSELERRCEFLLKENLMLMQQNISKKVIDRMSGKR